MLEKILELFKISQIKYIVSVDDCYKNLQSTVIDSELIEDILEDPDKCIEKFTINNLSIELKKNRNIPVEILKKKITNIIAEMNPAEKQELVDIYSDNFLLKTEKQLLLNFFNELKNENCINDFMKFENIDDAKSFFDNDIMNKWEPDEENKVLWLIDRDLGEVGKENEGFKLLEYFCDKARNWNIAILATNKLDNINDEENFDSYLNHFNFEVEDKNSIWRIDKNKIDISKQEEFAEEISYGLKRNATYKITNYLANTYVKGVTNASDKIKRLEQSTINNVIFEFSNSDGISSVETLFRILLVISKEKIYKEISDQHEQISKLIWKYEKLCENKKLSEIQNLKQVNRIRRSEKYNFLISKTLSPISYGDIFEIKGEQYILISQPCDISIRENGQRKNNNVVKSGLLVKISDSKPDYMDYEELNYYNLEKKYFVHFKETIFVELDILDLCSINEDGNACVSLDILKEKKVKEQNYFKGHRERLNKVIEKINILYEQKKAMVYRFNLLEKLVSTNIKEKNDEIMELIKTCQKSATESFNNDLSLHNFCIHENEISYEVQRVCRLDELYTINLSTKYYNVNSRLGLPGDFAKEYRYSTYKLRFQNPEIVFDKSQKNYIEIEGRELEIMESEMDNIENIIYERILKTINKEKIEEQFTKKLNENKEKRLKKSTKDIIEGIVNEYSMIDHEKKVIILNVEILNIIEKKTKNEIKLKKNSIKLPLEIIKNNAKTFYKEIEMHIGDKEFCKQNPCVRRFYTTNEAKEFILNENITFKDEEIKQKEIELYLEDDIYVKLMLSLIKKEGINYELQVECEEKIS